MRYFFAILSLAIAALMLVLGVGQRTFLAGPKAIQENLEVASSTEGFLVIPAEAFDQVTGSPSIVLTGENLFMAYANKRDVAAWVAPVDHLSVEPDAENKTFNLTKTSGVVADLTAEAEGAEDSPAFLDPRGSDLWLNEHEGETSLKVALSLEPNQAVLVSSGLEQANMPSEVTLMWAQSRNTPLAGPFLVTGAFFAILGTILYLIAIDHNRRGLGPRRGRRGPFQGLRNRRVMNERKSGGATNVTKTSFGVVTAVAGALLLTSCSPSYWPQQLPAEVQPSVPEVIDENQAVVPVTDAQLDLIIGRVVDVLNQADTELNKDLLQPRLTDAALLQREANYQIRKAQSEWRALPFLTVERLDYNLVQSTEKWPRTIFVTVNSVASLEEDKPEEDSAEATTADEPAVNDEGVAEEDPQPEELTPTLALILTQQSAHDNFQLNSIIELRGGIQMPEAAPLTEGTALLADDIQTLQLTPRGAVEALATVMQQGLETDEAAFFKFEEEPLVDKMGLSWATQQCIEGLQCSTEVSVSDFPIVTLSTGQSGALVLATIIDKHIMKVDSDRNVVKLSKVEEALGLDGSYEQVVREWQHQVLMYVPGKDSEKKMTILGSSSELVNATGVKSSISG